MNDRDERFRLYEAAVQSPEVEISLFERVYSERFLEAPMSLREDFCGSALLCRHWVESEADRVARGVDVDGDVIARAQRMNRAPLDEDEADRLSLIRGDARRRSDRTFDIITAGNYSWALLDPCGLTEYLESARDCLDERGLIALEFFGGADLRRTLVHEHPQEGFTYVWEQTGYEAATQRLDAAIHFRLEDGRELRQAFLYTFRLRTFSETRTAMQRAGFGRVTLWAENEGGGFVIADEEPKRGAWGGYVMGFAD